MAASTPWLHALKQVLSPQSHLFVQERNEAGSHARSADT